MAGIEDILKVIQFCEPLEILSCFRTLTLLLYP